MNIMKMQEERAETTMGKWKLISHRLSNKMHFLLRALLYKGSVAKEHGKQKGIKECRD